MANKRKRQKTRKQQKAKIRITDIPLTMLVFVLFIFIFSFFRWGYHLNSEDNAVFADGWFGLIIIDVIPLFHCYVFIFAFSVLILRTLKNAAILNCPHWIEILLGVYPVFHLSFLLFSFCLILFFADL